MLLVAEVFKSMSHHAMYLHPSKFDEQNADPTRPGETLWPVSDYLVGLLRADIAKRSYGRGWDLEPKKKDQKPYHGNLFTAMPDDIIDPVANKTIENAFKIYVYDVRDYSELETLTKGPSFCKDNQWGFEISLHDWFLASHWRTDNPEEADFFFVPHYTACSLNTDSYIFYKHDKHL